MPITDDIDIFIARKFATHATLDYVRNVVSSIRQLTDKKKILGKIRHNIKKYNMFKHNLKISNYAINKYISLAQSKKENSDKYRIRLVSKWVYFYAKSITLVGAFVRKFICVILKRIYNRKYVIYRYVEPKRLTNAEILKATEAIEANDPIIKPNVYIPPTLKYKKHKYQKSLSLLQEEYDSIKEVKTLAQEKLKKQLYQKIYYRTNGDKLKKAPIKGEYKEKYEVIVIKKNKLFDNKNTSKFILKHRNTKTHNTEVLRDKVYLEKYGSIMRGWVNYINSH